MMGDRGERGVSVAADMPQGARAWQDMFEARLADALVSRRLLTNGGLQEALHQQVILGGHLATNLWELELVDGVELNRLSAALLGLPLVDPQEIVAAPAEVRRLLSPELVAQTRLVPIRLVGAVLQVASAEPWDLVTLGRAAQHCGHPVEPHLIGEVPLVALMDKLYGVPTPARFLSLLESNDKLARGERETPEEKQGQRSVLLSYVSKEVERLRGRRERSALSERAAERVALAQLETADMLEEETLLEEVVLEPEPDVAPEPPPASVPASIDGLCFALPLPLPLPLPASASAPAPGAPLVVPPLADPAPPPPSYSALEPITDLHTALTALDAAVDRDEVGRVLLRFALGKGRRVVVFFRRALLWAGWTGGGAGVDAAALPSLLVPTAPGTIFGLVAETGGHFLGPFTAHPSYEPLLATLGGGAPRTAALMPVHFRGRLVFGVYLDGGAGRRVTTDIGDLVVLAQRVPQVIERLLAERVQG